MKLKLLLLIPLIIFFASLLVVFFSPIKFIPCETSATDPATSWEKTQCKGYYQTLNQPEGEKINVNGSGLLINLALLVCGSFLINGILFLLFFIIVSLQRKPKSELEKWDEIAEIAEEAQRRELPKKGLFSKMFKKEKPFEDKFEESEEQEDKL